MVARRIVSLCLTFFALNQCVHRFEASEVAALELTQEGEIDATTPLVSNGSVPLANSSEAAAETGNKANETDRRTSQSLSNSTPITVVDKHPVQAGPLIDLFGQQLISLVMIDEKSAELRPNFTSDALRGKKVIGVYFSADWCGPCRQFTPELVSFYKKMNNRRGMKDQFEIVWVSRCRDVNAYGQFFTHMGGWVALPPEEAMGERGAALSEKFKVKGIPTLILLDDLGQVITRDGRQKIPQDKAGIGFPWRNPLATLYMTLVPRTLRFMIRAQLGTIAENVIVVVRQAVGLRRKTSGAKLKN